MKVLTEHALRRLSGLFVTVGHRSRACGAPCQALSLRADDKTQAEVLDK